MQHSSALPFELQYFDIYVTAKRNNSIEQLSTYGHLYIKTYIEPMLQETEESLNLLMGRTSQYEYRDICHTKEWDYRHYRTIKSNIATLTIGIKANSSLRNDESHSPDNTITFDELHQFIKQMWTNHSELLELTNRLLDRIDCLEDWLNRRENNP